MCHRDIIPGVIVTRDNLPTLLPERTWMEEGLKMMRRQRKASKIDRIRMEKEQLRYKKLVRRHACTTAHAEAAAAIEAATIEASAAVNAAAAASGDIVTDIAAIARQLTDNELRNARATSIKILRQRMRERELERARERDNFVGVIQKPKSKEGRNATVVSATVTKDKVPQVDEKEKPAKKEKAGDLEQAEPDSAGDVSDGTKNKKDGESKADEEVSSAASEADGLDF